METLNNRTEKLSKDFNFFWSKLLSKEDDYYGKLDIFDLVNLKKAISNVNNVITLKVTKAFCDLLYKQRLISEMQLKLMKESVEKTSANANGYDIEYPSSDSEGSDNEVKIIAEIKCNIPVKEKSFGANQEKNIIEDIKHLNEGKSKSKLGAKVKNYLKFLVLLDDGIKTTDAANAIIASANKQNITNVEIWNPATQPKRISDFNPGTVYIVILKFN